MPFKLPVCKVSFTDTWWLCTVYKKSLKIPKGTTQWPKEKVQTTQWSKEKVQTTQWSKEKKTKGETKIYIETVHRK